MWIDKDGIVKVLQVCPSTAYKIINNLKAELSERGYLVNPNARVPIRYFCERYFLDEREVREAINSEVVMC